MPFVKEASAALPCLLCYSLSFVCSDHFPLVFCLPFDQIPHLWMVQTF
uniref:Uncharacterized protein n=1 Tax=Arundo donax TaxID=35708 RepID=A0A0A9ADA9_ARUDO